MSDSGKLAQLEGPPEVVFLNKSPQMLLRVFPSDEGSFEDMGLANAPPRIVSGYSARMRREEAEDLSWTMLVGIQIGDKVFTAVGMAQARAPLTQLEAFVQSFQLPPRAGATPRGVLRYFAGKPENPQYDLDTLSFEATVHRGHVDVKAPACAEPRPG